MIPTPRLSSRVVHSAFWRISKVSIDNVLRFLTFVVLARYLTPAEFGAFALASVFLSISGMLSSAGMGDVLIREENPDEELKNTIFWTNLGLATTLALILGILSPVIANAIGNKEIALILAVLSLTLIIGPLTSVNSAMALREFNVKKIEMVGLAASLVNSLASIAVAIYGGGLWALVAGSLCSSLVGFCLTKWLFPWSPKFQFSAPRLKSVLSFSGNMLAASLMQTLTVRMQELIASAYLSLTAVGHYRIGTRFMELISAGFIAPVSGLALVALSKVRDERDRMAHAYLRMVAVTSIVYCPMIVGFAAVAADAVPFVFGPQWVSSVLVVQVLSLLAPATVLAYFHGPTLSAVGRSDILRRITIMQFLGTMIFSLVGVRFGILGLVVAFVLRSYSTLPLQMRWLKDATGVSPGSALAAALKPFCASIAMAVLILAIQPWLRGELSSLPVRLAVSCLFGAAIYASLMMSLFRTSTLAHVQEFRRILGPKKHD